MSLFDLGDGLRWGEAIAIVQACLGDTRTHLGADAAGLVAPLSLAEIAQIAQATQGKSDFIWARRPDAPDAADVQRGREMLATRSAFRHSAGFEQAVQ